MITFVVGHDIRGYKISVAMAEKSAPRAPQSFGHGYYSFTFNLIFLCSCLNLKLKLTYLFCAGV